MKYVTADPRNGNLTYRRRVPKALRQRVGRSEFIKVLGKTEVEALLTYGPYHRHVEHLIALSKGGVTGLSPAEQRDRLTALLTERGADPYSAGLDDNERTWRGEAAEQLVSCYQDHDTGDYLNVPEETEKVATALLQGVPNGPIEPTITDAFKFYLEEKGKHLPEQRREQEARLARAEKRLIAAVGSDKQISQITRADARRWRDTRKEGKVKTSTIRREKNDISAVISLAISELDAGGDNPFRHLKLDKEIGNRSQKRSSRPIEVIEGVYGSFEKKLDLLQIWTLLDFTGARPSEIRMLKVSEVKLDHPVPHIVLQERVDRTLKTGWSERTVPLVGDALRVAKEMIRGRNDPDSYVFTRFIESRGLDRLSQALTKRVRKFTKDPKHVPYSLRHNMKDRMQAAEVFNGTQKAIEGHAPGAGQDASYGGPVSLEQKRDGLLKALSGYEAKTRG
ncbi:tyrosine-type recombinase/integrase [Jannaschia sp. 2305UL9-9]|uniref:tyrosine-type recombinase/integrase n=1 Tax=Jannaschia sp. 2305UL9-9 TaxID=3121638 RepID=UPI0035277371